MRFIYIFFNDKMKLDIAIQKYIKYRTFIQKLSSNCVIADNGALRRFNEFTFTKYSYIPDLEEISLDDFIDYAEVLSNSTFHRWKYGAKTCRLTHNSICNHQRRIRAFFRWCYYNQFMKQDFSRLQTGRVKKQESVSILTHEEVKQFFEVARTKKRKFIAVRDELLFRIAYFTWLRRNEILNLKFEQLLSDEQFQIVWKMAKSRTVYFDEESKIRQLALELKFQYEKNFWNDGNDYVFRALSTRCTEEHIGRSTIYLMLIDYKNKIWIDPHRRLTLHSFRHTFASTLLENGANIREVQVLLWHSSLKSTAIYTHISTDRLKACSSLLHLSR